MENGSSDIHVEGLADYMSTLVPGMELPQSEEDIPGGSSGRPPSLPPKTRQTDVSINGKASEEEQGSVALPKLPVVPPRRKEHKKSGQRPVSNGLPPTPKVHVSHQKKKNVMFGFLQVMLDLGL